MKKIMGKHGEHHVFQHLNQHLNDTNQPQHIIIGKSSILGRFCSGSLARGAFLYSFENLKEPMLMIFEGCTPGIRMEFLLFGGLNLSTSQPELDLFDLPSGIGMKIKQPNSNHQTCGNKRNLSFILYIISPLSIL